MHKIIRTVLVVFSLGILVSTTTTAQTSKKPVKPAATAKKPAAAPVKTTSAAPVLRTKTDSLCAAIGVSFANSITSQGITDINSEVLTKTITAALKGGKTTFDAESANQYIAGYFQKMMEEKGAGVRMEGEKFLEENKKRQGVTTTESGLQYEVIKTGDGPKPAATDKVKTHYHGTLTNGTVFDSSVDRGEPVEFPVNGVIKGWTEALQLMPVGSKWKLFIPYDLAYGERAAGPQIPAYSALVFEVELLEIVK